MSLTQREAFARLMEHMCKHDGNGGHGYSQVNRMGDGTTEAVDLGDGVTVTIAGGDRDCSSGIITCLRAVGVDTHNASYTGNMRSELLKTGLFEWQRMGVASARRGDIYLNEGHHTAMCTCADPDRLAQFSRSETHGITGRTGDQDGQESNIRAYYSYPWDGKLVWKGDGATIDGADTSVADNTDPGLGDVRYWGPKFNRQIQSQRGTTVDGVMSGQPRANREWFWAVDESGIEYGDGGSDMVRSLQGMFEDDGFSVGASGRDGYYGHDTIVGHQRWLESNGISVGASGCDGYQGHDSNRAVAQAINKGLYRA